jgi:hypothetical protein
MLRWKQSLSSGRLGGQLSGLGEGGSSPSFLLLLALLLLLPHTNAEMTRLTPLNDPSSFHIEQTSVLKFFGDGPRNEIINASAVVLDGRTVCRPKKDEVKNRIVIVALISLRCTLDEAYEELDERGAKAVILLIHPIHYWFTPYWHMSWDPWRLTNRRMLMVAVNRPNVLRAVDGDDTTFYKGALRLAEIQREWRRSADEGNLQLRLAPPWDTTLMDAYESVWWTLVFRVALPSWALYTAATACVNTLQYHRRRAEWAPGRVVCLIQVPVNLLIAVLLASGLYVSCSCHQ